MQYCLCLCVVCACVCVHVWYVCLCVHAHVYLTACLTVCLAQGCDYIVYLYDIVVCVIVGTNFVQGISRRHASLLLSPLTQNRRHGFWSGSISKGFASHLQVESKQRHVVHRHLEENGLGRNASDHANAHILYINSMHTYKNAYTLMHISTVCIHTHIHTTAYINSMHTYAHTH